MIEACLAAEMEDTAVFGFFVRKLPDSWGFLFAAGFEQVIHFLHEVRCTEQENPNVRASATYL